MRFPSSIFAALAAFSRRRSEMNARQRTLRAVSDLPAHVLKDIGWPSASGRDEDLFR